MPVEVEREVNEVPAVPLIEMLVIAPRAVSSELDDTQVVPPVAEIVLTSPALVQTEAPP
jgi:hypothetical protein